MPRRPKLLPFQKKGAKFLRDRRLALLGDEMGLGKTPQALVAQKHLPPPSLIICPAIGRRNWKKEFRKFLNVNNVHLVETHADIEAWNFVSHLVVSYNFASKLLKHIKDGGLGKIFSVLVADEIHFLKNTQATRTRAVLGKSGLVKHTKRVWGMSGTLMPNHAGELWPYLFVLGATKLKYHSWVKKFCNYHGGFQGGRFCGPLIITGTKKSAIPELKRILSTIMLRRTVEVLGDSLPPLIQGAEIIVEKPKKVSPDLLGELDIEKLEQERALVKSSLGTNLVANLDTLTMLAGSVSTLRRYTGACKVEALAAQVKTELDFQQYEKVIIFAVHKKVIEGLKHRLWEYEPVTIYGPDSPKARARAEFSFQNDPKCKILIGQILAAGTTLNLTAASQVIFAELDWVPGNNQQAAKRPHRIGQKKTVVWRTCSLANSIDERVNEILSSKLEDIRLTFGKSGRRKFKVRKNRDETKPEIERDHLMFKLTVEGATLQELVENLREGLLILEGKKRKNAAGAGRPKGSTKRAKNKKAKKEVEEEIEEDEIEETEDDVEVAEPANKARMDEFDEDLADEDDEDDEESEEEDDEEEDGGEQDEDEDEDDEESEEEDDEEEEEDQDDEDEEEEKPKARKRKKKAKRGKSKRGGKRAGVKKQISGKNPTQDDVRKVAKLYFNQVKKEGKPQKFKKLLASYKCEKIGDLKKGHYSNFVQKVQGLLK